VGGHCEKHYFEPAIDVCGCCLGEYCRDCVVYPFGADKLPYCMHCAVVAAGLRTGVGARPLDRAQRRAAMRRREELQAGPAERRNPGGHDARVSR
jgi:hypothetical protein